MEAPSDGLLFQVSVWVLSPRYRNSQQFTAKAKRLQMAAFINQAHNEGLNISYPVRRVSGFFSFSQGEHESNVALNFCAC